MKGKHANQHIFLALLFTLNIFSINAQFLNPTELHIYRVEYIKIAYGSEHKQIVMRLDFESNNTYLHSLPTGISKTFSVHGDPSCGSEVFKIGDYELRLPVKWGASPDYDERIMLSGPSHHGSIGMARGGVLWRYWTCYTLAPSTLILGGRDMYLQENHEFYGPPMSLSKGCDSWTHLVEIDGVGAYTYIPPSLYASKEFDIVFKTHNQTDCRELYAKMGIPVEKCHNEFMHRLEERDQTLKSASGFEYKMILPNVNEPDRLKLGRYAMSGMSLYVDLQHDLFTLAPAYRIAGEESNLYEHANAKIFDMSWIGVLTVFVSILWTFSIVKNYNQAFVESRTYFCTNAFFWIFMLYYMPHYADGMRFMMRAIRSEFGKWLAIAQIVVLFASWIISIRMIPVGYRYSRWFQPAFETLITFCMWASVAFSHDENGTLMFVLAVETVAAFTNLFRIFRDLFHSRAPYFNLIYCVWHCLLAFSFALEPLMRRSFSSFIFNLSIYILYFTCLIGFSVSLAVHMENLRYKSRNK